MKPLIRVLVLALVLALFCGCARKNFYGPLNPVGFYPERGMSNRELFNDLKPYYSKEAILACISNPNKDDRNRIIYARKKVIDIIYEEYTGKLSVRRAWTDLAMDLAKAGLTGAATLVPLADTKSILAGASTALATSQLAVTQRLFYEKTMPLIQANMDATRKAVWKNIEDNLTLPANKTEQDEAAKAAAEQAAATEAAAGKPATGKPAAVKPEIYTVEHALSDIEEYYAAGSLADALMHIVSVTPAPAPSATAPPTTVTPATASPATAPTATAPPGVVKKVKP